MKVLMSRDVIFYESLFPFRNIHENLFGDNMVIPNDIPDVSCPFQTVTQDFISSYEYNSNINDFINKNQYFDEPQQEGNNELPKSKWSVNF